MLWELLIMSTALRRAAFLTTALLLFAAAPAKSALTQGLNRAQFQALANNLFIEDFDSFANGTVLTSVAGVKLSSSIGQPLVTSRFLASTLPNGLGRTGVGFLLPSDTFTLTFDQAVTSFAIDINTFATAARSYRATLNTGEYAESVFEPFPGARTGQFVGFISDTPFTSVTISSAANSGYTLDTLLFGNANAVVPEPSSWALMIFGFGMIGAARRQQPRAKARLC